MTRRILALLAAVALLLAGPAAVPALAGFSVLRSTPASGATVTAPPTEVRITFDQPVNDVASTIQVQGSGGDLYNSGVLRVESGSTAVQPVRRLSPGSYQVNWTAGAAPGSPTTTGSFPFTVAAPPPPRAGAGQWIVLGVLALIILFLGSTLLRRRLDRRSRASGL